MSIREKVYKLSPFWLKNILVSIYGIKEFLKKYGNYYRIHYSKLQELLFSDRDKLDFFQKERLEELLFESMKYSEYYKKVFLNKSITKEKIEKENVIDILKKLPFLEKNILRKEIEHIVSKNPNRKTCCVVNTSGTTGTPMSIPFDSEAKQSTYAEWRRYYDWLGLPKKFKSVRFSGRIIIDPKTSKPPFWVYNLIERQLFMSTYHLLDENMSFYIKKLNKFKPEFIDGYPSAIYILAKYILENKIKLQFVPIAISTTAETLLEYQRKTIEEAFKCKVYNQYASSEGAPWIVECKEGNYHLWIDTGVFEFINKEKIEENLIMAEMVMTSFRNFKTPLIRYRIGDYVYLYKDEQICKCGSHYPIIHSVIGRQDDILYTKEKGYIGRLDPAYKGLTGIKKSKIVQNSIDSIDVLIVPGKEYTDEIGNILLENLYERLGNKVNITLKKVNDISLGKNAKFKSVERKFEINK